MVYVITPHRTVADGCRLADRELQALTIVSYSTFTSKFLM